MDDLGFLDGENEPCEQDDLKRLSILCLILKEKQKLISEMEKKLAMLKSEETKLSSEEIPMFLKQKGLKAIQLEDGHKVEIKESVHVSLPKTDLVKRKIVMDFIISNGGSPMIKEQISVEDPEQSFIEFLNKESIPYEYKKDIHPSTLKAWFSSKLGKSKNSIQEINEEDVPKEANLFIKKETKITE